MPKEASQVAIWSKHSLLGIKLATKGMSSTACGLTKVSSDSSPIACFCLLYLNQIDPNEALAQTCRCH